MAAKAVVQQLQDDIENVIAKYENLLTLSEVIGTLEMAKLNIYRQNQEDEDDDSVFDPN